MTASQPIVLRRYQHQGVAFLLEGRARLLADEMGLGKTVQVASALKAMRETDQLRRALIVAPSSLLMNWQREMERFGPRCAVWTSGQSDDQARRWLYRLPVPVLIVSYEAIRADFLLNPPPLLFDVVVFDEAQRLKNRESTTTIAARRVAARRRWLLSATPLENGVSDLGSLSEVLGLISVDQSTDARAVTESLQGQFLRRRKLDVLPELPELIVQEIPLQLGPRQALEYGELAERGSHGGSLAQILASITAMKKVCNRASDDSSVKADALRELLEEAAAERCKVIVISQYTETLKWLGEVLPLRCITFSGEYSQAQRDEALKAFREADEPIVLLLSLKAGGVGLNIVEATHVVLYDRWWTPAAEDQAIARAHRFGRTEPLVVYSFRVIDTVEDRIVQIAARKSALFDEMVEGRLSEAAEASGWTRHDLLEALGAPSR